MTGWSCRCRLIVIGALLAVCPWPGAAMAADETSHDASNHQAAAEPPEPSSAPAEDARGPLHTRLQSATPEDRARLAEERKRLSEAAAAVGTDPTAIIGYVQLGYGHNAFVSELRTDAATVVIRLPLTPNLVFQVTQPYLWAELNQPGGFRTNGVSDTTIRAGGRLYAGERVALFIGTDASFPTATEQQLGTGKYTIGPGMGLAVPLARVRSLFFLLVQDFNSVGGDSGRPDIHFTQFQAAVNTILSRRWWTLVQGTWATNWKNHHKTSLNLVGQLGYQMNRHWGLFAGAGGGVVDKDELLSLDWTVQAGVRWFFPGSIFSRAMFEGFKGD
jgi:hypothetical protein